MEKNKENIKEKIIVDDRLEQARLEKEFHKTKFGKFMRVVLIISCIICFMGIFLAGFSAYIHAKNLDLNIYQPIIDLTNVCIDYSGVGVFFSLIIYTILLPEFKKENEKTELKKGQVTVRKIINHPIMKVILVLNIVIPGINFCFDAWRLITQFITNIAG